MCIAACGIATMGMLAAGAAPAAPATAPAGTPPPDYSKIPADGNGAFISGKYRNLFAESGHSEADIDAKINKAYNQLFHGEQNQTIMFAGPKNDNGPTSYIVDIQHSDIRSEGMSYGMMIAVQLDKKEDFDAIWNWSRTYMYHDDPKHPTYGYFSWQMRPDGTAMSEMPAPDGEEYYAMSLLFAANRWGSGKGIYDYKAEGLRLLHNMVHREQITGSAGGRGRGRGVTEGPEVSDNPPMILFSPDNKTGTDASYHLPAFYELWSRWGAPEDKEFWAKAAIESRNFFYDSANPKTGLIPNQGRVPGSPAPAARGGGQFGGGGFGGGGGGFGGGGFGPPGGAGPQAAAGPGTQPGTQPAARGPGRRGPGGFGGGGGAFGGFREDAWRCASNWSVDWSWWAKDPREQELSDRLQAFFESQDMDKYGDNWQLDGTVIRDRHSPGLVSTNAVASLAAKDQVRARKFTDALWNLEVPQGNLFQYYDGLLYVMSLLHDSGRFRIIMPKQ